MWNVDDFSCSCSCCPWWAHDDDTLITRGTPAPHRANTASSPATQLLTVAWSPYLIGKEMHSKGATNYNVPQCMQVVQPLPLPRILYRQPAPLHTNDRDPVTHLCFNDIIPTFKHNNI